MIDELPPPKANPMISTTFARRFFAHLALLLLCGVLAPAQTVWGAPTVSQVTPRSLTVGKSSVVVIEGAELSAELRLLSAGGAVISGQTVRPGATANRVEMEVTLAPESAVGIVPFRVATGSGISAPVELAVDHLATVPWNAKVEALPTAMHGICAGQQVMKSQFTGAKGGRIVLDVQAQRLGSALRPVVRLYNARGTQIAWSSPKMGLGGDSRVVAILPADGVYSIEVHDQLFRAGNPAHFRMTMGDLQFADQTYPLAVQGGQSATLQSLGSQPLPQAFAGDATGIRGDRALTVDAAVAKVWTGPAPHVLVSGFAETKEPEMGAAAADLPAAPVGVSGILAKAGEEDKFLLPVTPGQTLRFDVISQRAGSGLDPILMIRNEQGGQLAANDDRPNTGDPGLDFGVPAGVNKIQVAIKDMEGRGSPQGVYRIEVMDVAAPSFAVTASESQWNLPLGGTQLVTYTATRNSYGGPIALSFPGLPAEVRVSGNVIPANANQALVTFTSPAQALPAGIITPVATSAGLPSPVARFVTHTAPAKVDLSKRTFGLASAPATSAVVSVQLPANPQLIQGGKLAATLKVVRSNGVAGPVRLKLVTSQTPPKKTVKVNNMDQQQDDVERTLRLEGMPALAADQSELPITLVVPADLPLIEWDLAVVAEVLSADGKNVVASAVSESFRIPAVSGITVALANKMDVEVKSGLGPTSKLVGKVQRLPGLTGPVVLALEGLPKGVSSPRLEIPADKDAFEFSLSVPFGTPTGEFPAVNLVAKLVTPNQGVLRSAPETFKAKIVAGEKPPVEKALLIFDEEEGFAGLLTEGEGRAAFVKDRFSRGVSSFSVIGPKSVAKLPTLGVKIRENPGPGEYRYIQFRWMTLSGSQLAIQLNHDGAWGPNASGASFRYHAGPGAEPFGASLQVADEAPKSFDLVTRDLYADFGEFTLDGIGFFGNGNEGFFDAIFLGRNAADFEP